MGRMTDELRLLLGVSPSPTPSTISAISNIGEIPPEGLDYEVFGGEEPFLETEPEDKRSLASKAAEFLAEVTVGPAAAVGAAKAIGKRAGPIPAAITYGAAYGGETLLDKAKQDILGTEPAGPGELAFKAGLSAVAPMWRQMQPTAKALYTTARGKAADALDRLGIKVPATLIEEKLGPFIRGTTKVKEATYAKVAEQITKGQEVIRKKTTGVVDRFVTKPVISRIVKTINTQNKALSSQYDEVFKGLQGQSAPAKPLFDAVRRAATKTEGSSSSDALIILNEFMPAFKNEIIPVSRDAFLAYIKKLPAGTFKKGQIKQLEKLVKGGSDETYLQVRGKIINAIPEDRLVIDAQGVDKVRRNIHGLTRTFKEPGTDRFTYASGNVNSQVRETVNQYVKLFAKQAGKPELAKKYTETLAVSQGKFGVVEGIKKFNKPVAELMEDLLNIQDPTKTAGIIDEFIRNNPTALGELLVKHPNPSAILKILKTQGGDDLVEMSKGSLTDYIRPMIMEGNEIIPAKLHQVLGKGAGKTKSNIVRAYKAAFRESFEEAQKEIGDIAIGDTFLKASRSTERTAGELADEAIRPTLVEDPFKTILHDLQVYGAIGALTGSAIGGTGTYFTTGGDLQRTGEGIFRGGATGGGIGAGIPLARATGTSLLQGLTELAKPKITEVTAKKLFSGTVTPRFLPATTKAVLPRLAGQTTFNLLRDNPLFTTPGLISPPPTVSGPIDQGSYFDPLELDESFLR